MVCFFFWGGVARKYEPSGCFSPLDMIRLLVPSFHRGIVRAGRQQAEEHQDVPYQRLIHSQVLLCTGRPQLRRKRSLSGYRGLPPDTPFSGDASHVCIFSVPSQGETRRETSRETPAVKELCLGVKAVPSLSELNTGAERKS